MTSKYDIVVPTIGKVAPLKDLFIFELGNIPFLVGKSKTICGASSYRRAFLLPVILAVVILLIGILAPAGIFLESFMIALVILALGVVACWSPYRNQLLSKEGKLIQGRIIATDEKEIRRRMPLLPVGPVHISLVSPAWKFGALCAFRTPDGKVISSRRYAIRNDLMNKVIMEGTPIVVLYSNPQHFKVL